ncbi:MAG: phytoene/squalene synthase family protein [Halobacteriaceae archaeon]
MYDPDREVPAEDHLEWCHEAVQGVSRTFALTVEELDVPMTDYICVGYLLCRIADTVEDATTIPPGEKRRLLADYRDAIDPGTTTTAAGFRDEAAQWRPDDAGEDWDVVRRAPRVLSTFRGFDAEVRDAMRPSILEMIDGMARFVERYADEGGIRINTMDELEDYSWYVAGTVSRLVTNLLAPSATDEQERVMRENAEDFALLLQLVNVAKDAREDYREENNTYLPRDQFERRGLDLSALDDAAKAADVAPVIRAVTERAERYADGAQAWIEAMPDAIGATRSAVAVPFLLAIATIRELEGRPEDVVAEGDVKVERAEVAALLDRFRDGDPSVARLRERMRERPLHET